VRDTDEARRDSVLAAIQKVCDDIAQRRGVRIHSDLVNSDAPAICDTKLIEALSRACEAQGLGYQRMVSRAYHDSLFMARIVPVAMLFIPCRAGVSHRPDEYASPEAIANGARVMAETLAQLAE
jgi:N-carbamoyl-L-amino-acid hydrolase